MFRNKKNNNGFTLIELLVVISIIALLTSIVLAALAEAKAKARDARRLEDMRTLQTTLTLYQNDHGGEFPLVTNGDKFGWEESINENFITKLVESKYLPSGIKDPLNTGTAPDYGFLYLYKKDDPDYPQCGTNISKILFKLETNMQNSYINCGSWRCVCLE